MRKITLLFALIAITLMGNATIYFDETFNYTDGTLKTNWTAGGTIGTWSSDFMVSGTPLSYSNTGGIPFLSGLGKGMTCDYQTPYGATNYYNYKSFNSTPVTTGTIYASFLYSPNGTLNTQSNAPILLLTGTASTTGVSVYVGKALAPNDATKFRFGTTRGSSTSGDIKWGSTEFVNETYKTSVFFIVLKYDLSTQTSYIFIDPVVGSAVEAPVEASDATSTSSTKSSLQVIEVKTNGSTKTVYKLGGVRVSTTWAEAVAPQSTAAPLSTPAVGTASLVTATGFTANWTAVANAVGYDVKVYLGANLISTTNVSGQATESLAITGLMSGIGYTYKVIAKGDITNFSDSELSAASTSFTTLDPYASNALNTDFGDVSWGEAVLVQPATGTYPSSNVNGFNLNAAVLYTTNGVVKGIKGESHTNRIALDKLAAGGMVTFPTVNSVEQIEIHATAGTAGNGFQLKEFNASTNTWNAIGGTYVYDANSKASGLDSIYIIPISRTVPTKFRIENPTNGGIYLLQVITRTTNPSLLSKPIVGGASGISSTGFSANWNKVTNATGYKVFVYDGTTLIDGAPYSVIGENVETLSIIGLTPETAYTFKVQAIGNGDFSLSDSFLSFAGIATTSTATGIAFSDQKIKLIVTGKTVTAPETGNFEVYNLHGAKVLQAYHVNTIKTNLPNGLFIVNFTNENGKQFIQKIAIK
ncbi:MAG TPA: hypothetical protein P5084_07100 [Paludibacter sp.]|nr:hypothetical protein [Paludibacter sp.]